MALALLDPLGIACPLCHAAAGDACLARSVGEPHADRIAGLQ